MPAVSSAPRFNATEKGRATSSYVVVPQPVSVHSDPFEQLPAACAVMPMVVRGNSPELGDPRLHHLKLSRHLHGRWRRFSRNYHTELGTLRRSTQLPVLRSLARGGAHNHGIYDQNSP